MLKKYSILVDHLGTPIQMYNDTGESIWERSLDSFGRVEKRNHSTCPFMYQRQYYNKEIELAYNRFRYYDPNDGRYISVDPIGLESNENNFYSYMENPNFWIDIFGLASRAYGPKKKKGIARGQSKQRRPRKKVKNLRKRKKTKEDFVEFENRDGVLPANKKYTEHDFESPPTN